MNMIAFGSFPTMLEWITVPKIRGLSQPPKVKLGCLLQLIKFQPLYVVYT